VSKCWWGQSESRLAGEYFSATIGLIVYFGTEAMVAVLTGVVMLNLILRHRYVKPNVFAQDLANGLSPVGNFVLTSFFTSLVGSVAIFIILRLGYFGVENLFVVWFLIIVASTFIPLATLAPMYSAINLISECKHSILQNINTIFYSRAGGDDHAGSQVEWIKGVQPAIALYKHISDLNSLPFDKNKAFVSAITFAFVALQTGYNVFKLFH
jgi:hypothetical protein